MATNATLKVGIIGCGKMGMHHIKAIQMEENAVVAAIADPNLDREKLADVIPSDVKIFDDAEQMLRDMTLDVVHIVTPPHTHTDLARKVLEKGCHVYVEKPFSLKTSETVETLAIAKRNNLKVCAAHQVLFQEPGVKYRKYLPWIKDIVHVESYFSFKTVRAAVDGKGAISPIDQLIDILPHPVYLMLSAMELAHGDADAALEMKSLEVDPDGDVHAIFKMGQTTGLLVVTLRGRPIESYLRIVGTNGAINADFVLTGVTKLPGPGASAISQVLMPFSRSRQLMFNTVATIWKMVFRKHKSYAGLAELVGEFYKSIRENTASPVSETSILETVRICEDIAGRLKQADAVREEAVGKRLAEVEAGMPQPDTSKQTVLVTGGTGFLGKVFIKKLRDRGWPVRVLARRIPAARQRVPGVEYIQSDIGDAISADCFKGVGAVAHLAAETAGGKEAHERNTIGATQKLVDGAVAAGVKQFVNISSIAVLKPSSEVGGPLREDSPVDADNLGRGPYVWGKAAAERIASDATRASGISCKTIRLGPLVDFADFTPPGRLGREVGTLFVAMGSKKGKLSLCDVSTAADVIVHYVEHFDAVPEMLNLVEPDAPTRGELVDRMRRLRPELSFMWLPDPVLKGLSELLKLVLRVLKRGSKPLDLYAAFASEKYDAGAARKVIEDMRRAGG